MKKYNIEDIKNWYENKNEPTYLAIHIETKDQYDVLKEYMPVLTEWSSVKFWYLQSGGISDRRSSYESDSCLIIEFNEILFKPEEYEIY